MKSKLHLVLIFAFVAVVCLMGWKSSAQTSNKVTWEYYIYRLNTFTPNAPAPDLNEFNRLGAEGWEFVESRSTEAQMGSSTQRSVEYYFKRMK